MDTGIKLIALEREEQIRKHGRTVRTDAEFNKIGQLRSAARKLLSPFVNDLCPPKGWDKKIWNKMKRKTLKERLIIAGALLAAEIDRLQFDKNEIERLIRTSR